MQKLNIILFTFDGIAKGYSRLIFRTEDIFIEHVIATLNSFGFEKEETKSYLIHYIKIPPTDCVVKALIKHFGDSRGT